MTPMRNVNAAPWRARIEEGQARPRTNTPSQHGKIQNMTRLWTALAASALALHTAAPAFAEDIKLRFAGVFPIDHQGTKMMEQVAADVNAAGVGLDMTVYPASQLGSGEALFEDVARGNIDFASAFIYSDTDPRLEFLNMPFLVSSYDDMERVLMDMDSDYNRILQEITAEYGVRVMAAGWVRRWSAPQM